MQDGAQSGHLRRRQDDRGKQERPTSVWVFCLVESILVALAHIEIFLVALLGTDCLCVTVSKHRFLVTATHNAYFSVALDRGVNVTYCVCLHFVLLANLHKYTTRLCFYFGNLSLNPCSCCIFTMRSLKLLSVCHSSCINFP